MKNIDSVLKTFIVFSTLLIVLIIAYETFIVSNGNKSYIYVSNQEWVSQRIAKDVLILQYKSKDEKAIAINELQNMLPYFEENQKQILATSQSDHVEILLRIANIDFIDIDTSVKKIIENSDQPVDSVQVQIILDHERPFFLAYAQINALLLQDIQARSMMIYTVIIIAKVILICTNIFMLHYVQKWKGEHATLKQTQQDDQNQSSDS